MPCLLPRTANLPRSLRSRMPTTLPWPSHIGNAQAECAAAHAAPTAVTDAEDKPSDEANASSSAGDVIASQSRISFVALIVGLRSPSPPRTRTSAADRRKECASERKSGRDRPSGGEEVIGPG